MGGWKPQSHHGRVETTESPQEDGNHRVTTGEWKTTESPQEGGNHRRVETMESAWEGGNHRVTTLTDIQEVTTQQLTSSSQVCK